MRRLAKVVSRITSQLFAVGTADAPINAAHGEGRFPDHLLANTKVLREPEVPAAPA